MIDAALLFAFIEVESSGNPKAFAKDPNGGSYGWTQIDYATAHDRGFDGNPLDLYDPATNVKYHCAIIDWITERLEHAGVYSIESLAASYNAGLHHVLSGGTDKPYSDKIATAYEKWKAVIGETP